MAQGALMGRQAWPRRWKGVREEEREEEKWSRDETTKRAEGNSTASAPGRRRGRAERARWHREHRRRGGDKREAVVVSEARTETCSNIGPLGRRPFEVCMITAQNLRSEMCTCTLRHVSTRQHNLYQTSRAPPDRGTICTKCTKEPLPSLLKHASSDCRVEIIPFDAHRSRVAKAMHRLAYSMPVVAKAQHRFDTKPSAEPSLVRGVGRLWRLDKDISIWIFSAVALCDRSVQNIRGLV